MRSVFVSEPDFSRKDQPQLTLQLDTTPGRMTATVFSSGGATLGVFHLNQWARRTLKAHAKLAEHEQLEAKEGPYPAEQTAEVKPRTRPPDVVLQKLSDGPSGPLFPPLSSLSSLLSSRRVPPLGGTRKGRGKKEKKK